MSKYVDIEKQLNARKAEYIGDGVYAIWDGWHVWLTTPREEYTGWHYVALDPTILFRAQRFFEKCTAWEKEQRDNKSDG